MEPPAVERHDRDSKALLQDHLGQLEARGLMKVERRNGRRSNYTVLDGAYPYLNHPRTESCSVCRAVQENANHYGFRGGTDAESVVVATQNPEGTTTDSAIVESLRRVEGEDEPTTHPSSSPSISVSEESEERSHKETVPDFKRRES